MPNLSPNFQPRTAKVAGARLVALIRHPMTLIFLVALSAWLLAGFNIGPIDDGWTFLTGPTVTGGGATARWATGRPFIPIPTFLALTLIPHSFQGWQLVMLAVTAARGLLFFAIVRRLAPNQPLFWLACGLVATYHPADDSFFWAECVGPHFGLDLALAACLTSVIYIQDGSTWTLCLTWLLQFLACFTYSSCLPLMMALPVGAWLLSWTQGVAPRIWRLLEITVPIVLLTCVYAWMILSGNGGRATNVASFDIDGVIAGFPYESVQFVTQTKAIFSLFRPVYLAVAVIPAVLAYYIATPASSNRPVPCALKSQVIWFTGLIVLAAVSYLPFALSTVRFGVLRQMMAPGIFLYSAGLFFVFVTLPGWFHARHWQALAVLVLAGVTVVVGLEKRENYVDGYRDEAHLLAAIADILPDPPANTTVVVHLANIDQFYKLEGLYNRTVAFTGALRFMYNDYSGGNPIHISGGFTMFGSDPMLTFTKQNLLAGHVWQPDYQIEAPYNHMVLIDYDANGRAKILDRAWLEKFAPKGTDLHAYRPVTQGVRRSSASNVCTMLERDYRPSYCSTGN